MAGSLNKVTLIGHLGKDPVTRTFPNGGKVVNLSLATSESWTDKQTGERKKRTEWHSISILNEGIAGVAEKYLRKGSSVYIEGQLETRKWQDKDGIDRYTTENVLRSYGGSLTLLDNRNDQSSGAETYDQSPQSQSPTTYTPTAPDLDDEIPF